MLTWKEGMGFTSLSTADVRSYRDETGTRSSRIVPRSLLVAEESYTAFYIAEHVYSDQAIPLDDPAEIPTYELTLTM